MMLHGTDNDLIAFLDHCFAKGEGEEIDTFGCATCEDNLIDRAGIDEGPHFLTAGLMEVGGLLRKEVHSAVDIGVDIVIFIHHGFYDTPWLLCRGSIVEIDKGTVVNLSGEDGEIVPYSLYIVHLCMLMIYSILLMIRLSLINTILIRLSLICVCASSMRDATLLLSQVGCDASKEVTK